MHKIEELEVLSQWHPRFGRVVYVHEVFEQRAGDAQRTCGRLSEIVVHRVDLGQAERHEPILTGQRAACWSDQMSPLRAETDDPLYRRKTQYPSLQ
jgi:hypothetical protein